MRWCSVSYHLSPFKAILHKTEAIQIKKTESPSKMRNTPKHTEDLYHWGEHHYGDRGVNWTTGMDGGGIDSMDDLPDATSVETWPYLGNY